MKMSQNYKCTGYDNIVLIVSTQIVDILGSILKVQRELQTPVCCWRLLCSFHRIGLLLAVQDGVCKNGRCPPEAPTYQVGENLPCVANSIVHGGKMRANL